MTFRNAALHSLFVLVLAMPVMTHAQSTNHVLGWVEKIQFAEWGVEVKAKVDTGALTSSMHATHIERFEKDGDKWVRFMVDVEDQRNEESVQKLFERPLYRNVILRGAGGEDRRPVVLMEVCIGQAVYEEQFSLEDRSDMLYPVLLGRRTIQHLGVVDVTRTFVTEARCDQDSPRYTFDEEGA
ncbi:MAG: retropepsin-like aspartic peptidase RloA3 [Algiphilus sp.]